MMIYTKYIIHITHIIEHICSKRRVWTCKQLSMILTDFLFTIHTAHLIRNLSMQYKYDSNIYYLIV